MTNKPLTFDLDRQEKAVVISGEEYVLVELDGKQRDKYLNNITARLRSNAKGEVAGVKNFDGMQAGLVAQSLFKLVDGAHVPVTQDTIQSWPARVVNGLHDAAKELSDLGGEDEEDTAGNE